MVAQAVKSKGREYWEKCLCVTDAAHHVPLWVSGYRNRPPSAAEELQLSRGLPMAAPHVMER